MSSFRLANRAATTAFKAIARASIVKASVPTTQRAIIAPRLFSTSSIALNTAKKEFHDAVLAEIEHEAGTDNSLPESLQEYFDKTGFKFENTIGQSLCRLTRETDAEVLDLYLDVNQAVNLRAIEENMDESEAEFEQRPDDFFLNVNLVITKKVDDTAVSLDLIFRTIDSCIAVEGITYYNTSAEALGETADAEQKREIAYHGPPIDNLDEKVLVSLENYMQELGINNELLHHLINFSIYKENEEYLRWLANMEKFFR